FVAGAAVDAGNDRMTTRRRRVTVKRTRGIGPRDLVLNDRLGAVDVDPASGYVTLDGEPVYVDPADEVPLSRLYFL
ncbi:MAG TPA: urease subunit alpha, partial [Acidimicrobiaceae bacterium]|nr:urease subunit alpha [Acidimicrobiaceae bacterium]